MTHSLRKFFFLRTNTKARACSMIRKELIHYLIKKRMNTALNILFLLALVLVMFLASQVDPKDVFKNIEKPDLMTGISKSFQHFT